MNDQTDIDYINKKLYQLQIPNEPMHKIMFYFKLHHNVIDYQFPPNFLNYGVPYFKTYKDIKQFVSLAKSLNPEFLNLKNVIIYHDDANFYKNKQNIYDHQFKIIIPEESKSLKFNNNYKNKFNIKNIDSNQKQFDIQIKNDIELSDNSEHFHAEDYYYEN